MEDFCPAAIAALPDIDTLASLATLIWRLLQLHDRLSRRRLNAPDRVARVAVEVTHADEATR